MATNRDDDNLLDQDLVATTDAIDNAALNAVETVGTGNMQVVRLGRQHLQNQN